MQTKTQKWLAGLSTFAFAIGLMSAWAPQADARMVFSTEEGSTNADSYTIDYDDSAGTGTVILRFGTSVDETLSYDNLNNLFKFSNDLSLEGNELSNFRIENSNGSVAVCNAALYGRIYFDTSDDGTYVCTSTGWENLEDHFTATDYLKSNESDNYTGTGTMSFDAGTTLDVNGTFNADDATVSINGINNNTFVLDEDGNATDVILTFGSTIAESIMWDNTNSYFNISDDLNIQGNLTISGTFTGDLAANTVETSDIQNFAITTAKISTGAVTTNQIADGTITANDIAGNTITSAEIAANAITSSELADNAVDTDAIQDGAITASKIADGAITVNLIQSESITSDKIATGAVTTAEIADGTILNEDIANGTINIAKLANRNKSTLISPEYPNFTLYGDGTANSGTLDADRDATANKNYYSWTSRKTVLNDYDILVQFQIPEDFSSWQANAIQVFYKTDDGDTTDNSVQVYVDDTTGTSDYTGSALASASWTSTAITSAGLTGTYTAGDYLTLGIKLSSRRDGGSAVAAPRAAYAGEIKFNYVGK